MKDERFEYTRSLGVGFICDITHTYSSTATSKSDEVISLKVSGYDYVFIQFNAVHSTRAHRGYAIAYEVTTGKSVKNVKARLSTTLHNQLGLNLCNKKVICRNG